MSSRSPLLIELLPWTEDSFELLRALNTPEQKMHLGGLESEDELRDRQRRYLTSNETSGKERMFRITVDGKVAGAIGYWERRWNGETIYETGWEVLPAFRGRGVAIGAAAALLARLRAEKQHQYVHAYPSLDNAASNALCRKLGFEFVNVTDFEFPKGHSLQVNDWRYDLTR